MKDKIYKIYGKMPYVIKKTILHFINNEKIEIICLNSYLRRLYTNFDKEIKRVKKKNRAYIIKNSKYKFQFFDVCFANCMMGNVIYCLFKGYLPVFENVWTDYFKNPFNIDKSIKTYLYPFVESPLQPKLEDIYEDDKKEIWFFLFKKIFVLNTKSYEYVKSELKLIHDNEKVLGVLVRGTDYVRIQPEGHPVQPKVEIIVNDVMKQIKSGAYKKIYLATDEYEVVKKFERVFPCTILTNQRQYFDVINEQDSTMLISEVHFERDNDNYYKGIEYLSSLLLLSECDGFIGGNCGGSTFAYYMQKERYDYCKIYNLGVY